MRLKSRQKPQGQGKTRDQVREPVLFPEGSRNSLKGAEHGPDEASVWRAEYKGRH